VDRERGKGIIQLGMGCSKMAGNTAMKGVDRERGKGIIQLDMGCSKMA
jgi:hypothetical protein